MPVEGWDVPRGYYAPDPEPELKFDEIECPNCGKVARADFVDNGVGMQQCGPYGCEACGWHEEPVKLGEPTDPDEISF